MSGLSGKRCVVTGANSGIGKALALALAKDDVEVVLEGWHVLIRDLATTNGTTVSLPGGQPVRLRANDQQVLEPGSVVALADEVTFVFDPGTS